MERPRSLIKYVLPQLASGATTKAVGEEGGVTTMMVGEESAKPVTTLVVGEEAGKPRL